MTTLNTTIDTPLVTLTAADLESASYLDGDGREHPVEIIGRLVIGRFILCRRLADKTPVAVEEPKLKLNWKNPIFNKV